MASTYSLTSRTYDGRYLKLECSQQKDIEYNRSKITWKLSSVGGDVGHYTIAPTVVKINGTVVYSIPKTDYTLDVFPVIKGSVSGTIYVDHNTDGSKTIPVYLSTNIYDWTPIEYSGNWSLDSIQRNAYITSAPDFTDNSNPTVSYKNPTGMNATSLDICISFDTSMDDIPYRTIDKLGSSYKFNLTDAERDILRNGTSGTSRDLYFCIRTVLDGKTLYDVEKKKLTIQETNTTKPSVSASVSANNGNIPSAFNGLYIQGESKVNVSISAQGKYGATIKEYTTSIQGKTYKNQSFASDYLMKSGDSIPINSTVKDSRGFTNSPETTPTIKVHAYSKPKISSIAGVSEVMCYRSNSDGTKNNSGTLIWIKAKKVFSKIFVNGSNINNCTMRFRTKLASASEFGSWTTLSTTDDEYNALIPGVFNVEDSYTIELGVVDTVGESGTIIFDIPTDDVVLHLGEGGKSVGIGRYASDTNENRVDIGWDTHFEKNVYIDDSIVSDFVVDQGISGAWRYRKWYSGTLELWGRFGKSIGSWNAWNSLYESGNYIQEDFPIAFVGDPPVLTTGLRADSFGGMLETDGVTTLQKTPKYYVTRTSNTVSVSTSFGLDIYATGRWK